MAWHMIYRTATGAPVSLGEIVATPLPAGLTDLVLSDPDAAGLRNGTKVWNSTTHACDDAPPNLTEAQRAALYAKAQPALDSNATFLAIASPSNAQVLLQVQRLTRQVDGLIRLGQDALLVANTDT